MDVAVPRRHSRRPNREGQRLEDGGRRAGRPRCDQHHAGRRLERRRHPGRPITLVGWVNENPGLLRLPGTPLHHPARRQRPVRRRPGQPAQPEAGRRRRAGHSGGDGACQRARKPAPPDIDLTSTPPLEQADILALIVFNQPLNQLGEGQQISLAQRAGSIAAGAVTSQLTGSIASSLQPRSVDINLSPNSGSAAEVTSRTAAGTESLRESAAGNQQQQPDERVLECETTKWLRLQNKRAGRLDTQQQFFQKVRHQSDLCPRSSSNSAD